MPKFSGLVAGTALAFALASPAFATTYDAVTSFSGATNPGGVWSYLDGGGTLLSTQFTNAAGGAGWWNNGSFPTASAVSSNAGAAVTSGTVVYAANAVHLDGQGMGAELRFTSAAGGTYSLSGQFFSGDTNMATHTVSIVDNLNNSLFSFLLANNVTKTFSLSGITLGAGGYLDFISGTDGGASYAGTSLQLSVADSIPEPVSLAVLGTGLAGLGLVRRKRA